MPPTPPLPPLLTSFRSVLILSLASSIRLASMKSLYLSGSRTWGGGSEPGRGERGPPQGQGPLDAPARDAGAGGAAQAPLGQGTEGQGGTRAGAGDSEGRGSTEPLALPWVLAWGLGTCPQHGDGWDRLWGCCSAQYQPSTLGHRRRGICGHFGGPDGPGGSARLGHSNSPSVKRGSGSFRKKDFNRLLMTFRSCHRCGGEKWLLRDIAGQAQAPAGESPQAGGVQATNTEGGTPASTTVAVRMAGRLPPPCVWQGKLWAAAAM